MYLEAVFRFYVLLNHFVGHFFFGLVRFGSFSNTIYRNLALALSKLHINVDITVGFFVGQKNYRLAVLTDESQYEEFAARVNGEDSITTVYIVTDSEPGYREMVSGLHAEDTYQLYRDYLDNFRINHGGR